MIGVFSDNHLKKLLLENRYLLIVLFLSAIYIIFFSWVGIWWHGLYYTNVDLDIFEQALWTTINTGDILYTNEYGGSSHFGTHFSPILFLMIPVYALFQQTETIIIMQVILLGLAAIPLFLISSTLLSKREGLIISAVYLLYPALHGATTCEFHEIVFFPILFFFAFAMLMKEKYSLYFLFAFLCLLIKEDICLIILMLGLWGLIKDRNNTRKIQITHRVLIAVSIIICIGAIFIITPAFNPDGVYPHFSNPYFTSDTEGNGIQDRGIYILQLFGPLLGIPLLAPEILLIGIFGFFEILVPDYQPFWDIGTQYTTILIPMIFIALVYGYKRITSYITAPRAPLIILFLLLISSGVSTILISPSPLSLGYQHVWAYDQKIQPYKQTLDPIISSINENREISVGSHHPFLTHLAGRKFLYTTYDERSDIILVAEGYPDGKKLKEMINSSIFTPVFHSYDITVFINNYGKLKDRIKQVS